MQLDFVKRKITDMGQLEFRITADPTLAQSTERESSSLAKLLPPAQKESTLDGRTVAEWVAYYGR